MLCTLFIDIKNLLDSKNIPLDDVKEYLSFYPELRCEVATSKSLIEVLNIVRDHTSLCNVAYLEEIAEHFKLKEASNLIKTYNESIETFCKEIPVKHAYGQIFMEHFTKHLLKSRTVRFVLEWEADKKTLSDIQSVLRKAFHEHISQVKILMEDPSLSFVMLRFIFMNY